MKYWRIGLFSAIISLVAVYLVMQQMDIRLLGDAFARTDYGYLLPSATLVILGLAARAMRWRALLNGILPIRRIFSILNVSYLVNGALPLRVGEVARAYLATQGIPSVPFFKSTSTIVVERLLDVLAVLVVLALALSAGPLPDELRTGAVVFAPLMLGAFLVLVLMASQQTRILGLMERVSSRYPILRRWRVKILLGHFLDGLLPLTQPRILMSSLMWTAISWALTLAFGYVLMLMFFKQADWAVTCLVMAATSFVVAIPAVPGNFGPYELSILLALRATGYGQPPEVATAFALVAHAISLGVMAILGVLGFIQEGVSLKQLSQAVRGTDRNDKLTQPPLPS